MSGTQITPGVADKSNRPDRPAGQWQSMRDGAGSREGERRLVHDHHGGPGIEEVTRPFIGAGSCEVGGVDVDAVAQLGPVVSSNHGGGDGRVHVPAGQVRPGEQASVRLGQRPGAGSEFGEVGC